MTLHKPLLLALSLAAAAALQAQTPPAPKPDCAATAKSQAEHACAMGAPATKLDPAALMASNPPAAGVAKGPLTRRQVVAEIERARRNGEMDFARQELGPYQPSATK